MLYPQILSAHTKDLVHVTPPCALFPTVTAKVGTITSSCYYEGIALSKGLAVKVFEYSIRA